jgi:hypothetical protein
VFIVTPRSQSAAYNTLDGALAAAKDRAMEESGREWVVAEVIHYVQEVTSKSMEVTQANG